MLLDSAESLQIVLAATDAGVPALGSPVVNGHPRAIIAVVADLRAEIRA